MFNTLQFAQNIYLVYIFRILFLQPKHGHPDFSFWSKSWSISSNWDKLNNRNHDYPELLKFRQMQKNRIRPDAKRSESDQMSKNRIRPDVKRPESRQMSKYKIRTDTKDQNFAKC